MDHTVCVGLTLAMQYVHVKKSILVHRHSVGRNVWLAVNVCPIELVLIRNVSTHASELVVIMLNVLLSITTRYVVVLQVTPEIHSCIASLKEVS